MLSYSSRDVFNDLSSCPDSYVMNSVTFQQPRASNSRNSTSITTIRTGREERAEIKTRKSKRGGIGGDGGKKGADKTTPGLDTEGGERNTEGVDDDNDDEKTVTRCPNHLWYAFIEFLFFYFCITAAALQSSTTKYCQRNVMVVIQRCVSVV